MLALTIALLFTVAGLAAVVVMADSALKARTAYARLMAEAAVLETAVGMAASVQGGQAHRPYRRAVNNRPVSLQRARPLPACAAA